MNFLLSLHRSKEPVTEPLSLPLLFDVEVQDTEGLTLNQRHVAILQGKRRVKGSGARRCSRGRQASKWRARAPYPNKQFFLAHLEYSDQGVAIHKGVQGVI